MDDTSIPKNTKPTSIIALVIAAAAAIGPFTMSEEGTKYKTYLDPAHVPTACTGHTGKDIHLGQSFTKDQCVGFYNKDMQKAMAFDLKIVPELKDNSNALKASGDATFNAGIGSYQKSPMAAYFKQSKWEDGCKAFLNWHTKIRTSHPLHHQSCTYEPLKKSYVCTLSDLVQRRQKESKLCITGSE